MAVGDHGLTLMSSITLTSVASWFSFYNLWDGDYEGLYCTANIKVVETTSSSIQIMMPGQYTVNALIVNFQGINNSAIQAQRWTTNYGGIQQSRIWQTATSPSGQGAATIGLEFWIQNRKLGGVSKNCIFHGGSGEGVTNTANKYVWTQGAVSSRDTTHINNIDLKVTNTSNTLIDAQIGSTVQLYGIRKS
jgi:hypothetical protein